MTASAVSSLSLEPLQLLLCISTDLYTHEVLERVGRLSVNVLGEDQAELALRFADSDVDRFADLAPREGWSCPVLEDAIAVFECDVSDMLPGGDRHDLRGSGAQVRSRRGRASADLLGEWIRRTGLTRVQATCIRRRAAGSHRESKRSAYGGRGD